MSIDYAPQSWSDGSGGGTPISAARLQHIEDGLDDTAEAVMARAQLAGATFTGNITAPNMTGIIALPVGAAVPVGTPVNTTIVRS